MLYGVNVPSTSGHTLFANAVNVYERLPAEWKARIAGRRALHTAVKHVRIRAEHAGLSMAEFKALMEEKYPKIEHPLVMTDAGTGADYVYGAPDSLDSVIGFDANDNERYFQVLDDLIQDPDYVYTHRWTTNDLVVWKTRTTLHAATAVAPGRSRTVHRISLAEE
ncbi:hypothetical protein NOGI109294_09405 [Nocardiopsis gilva]